MFDYPVPPHEAHSQNGSQTHASWQVAVVANVKDEVDLGDDAPPDAGAEFDRHETIQAIAAALEAEGHVVHFCPADHNLPAALLQLKPDICFNIAEGLSGDAREAQVPALLELLRLPYTASRVLANALSLDKAHTKRIWRSYGLPTPHFLELHSASQPLGSKLRYPLFVKPAREGTGMGVSGQSVVLNDSELRRQVQYILDTYHQPALVEEYLPGREFTVGFIGNPGNPANRRHPELYDRNGYHFFPVLEIGTSQSVSPGIYGYAAKSLDLDEAGAPAYICPAEISRALRRRLVDLTRRAAEAVGAWDVSRVDFRLDARGEPQLLEINTLPGLNPSVSDLCIMARAEGMPYNMLISEILYLAAERFGLRQARSSGQLATASAFAGAF